MKLVEFSIGTYAVVTRVSNITRSSRAHLEYSYVVGVISRLEQRGAGVPEVVHASRLGRLFEQTKALNS